MKRNIIRKFIGFALTASLVLSPASVHAFEFVPSMEYTKTPSDIMYLEGLSMTYGNDKKSYRLYDIDQDTVTELFVGVEKGSSDTMQIYTYNADKQTAVKKKTIKKAVGVYESADQGMIVVETKAAPKNTFTEYILKGNKLKKKNTYRAEKGGSYYRNNKKISADKYKAYVKTLKEDHEKLVFTEGGEPWVNTAVIGSTDVTGDPGLNNDFFTSTLYSWLSEEHLTDPATPGSSASDAGTLYTGKANASQDQENLFSDRTTYKGGYIDIVRTAYDMATDWDARNKDGVAPLKQYLDSIESVDSLSDLSALVCDPEANAGNYFFGYAVTINNHDMSEWECSLVPDNMSANVFDMTDPEVTDEEIADARYGFGETVKYLLRRCGYSASSADRILSECYKAEDQILSLYTETAAPEPDPADPTRSAEKSYDEIISMFSNYPMKEALASLGITKGDFYGVYTKYLEGLDKYYIEENLSCLKAYLIAHITSRAAMYLDLEAAAVAAGIYDVNGEQKPETTSVYTEEEIKASLDEISMADAMTGITATSFANAYAENFVDEDLKTDLTGLSADIKDSFREIIMGEDWLSDKTKATAVDKLDAIRYHILSPDVLTDSTCQLMDKNEPYLKAYMDSKNRWIHHLVSYIGQPIDHDIWYYDLVPSLATTTFNCFYSANFNSIYILKAFTDDSFYNTDLSYEEKLGMLGFVVGHEFTHGFDPTGVCYDKYGNNVSTADHPEGWLEKEDYDKFLAKVQKMADYYNNIYPLPGLACIGDNLTGEATADMGGLAIGLNIAEKKDGFDYNKYFESYAKLWQLQATYDAQAGKRVTDTHPLAVLRVNATLQQFDEFFDTYGIKEGDGMYLAPEDRVKIW